MHTKQRGSPASLPLLLLLWAACVWAWVSAQNPPECEHEDCPLFKRVWGNQSFEVRQYAPARWARTNVSSHSFAAAVNVGFERLFRYIAGDNALNATIPMAAPVTTEVVPGEGPFCESTFVVGFYCPHKYQAPNPPPPSPSSSDIYLFDAPPTTKAVYKFPGYAMTWHQVLPAILQCVDFIETELEPMGLAYVPNIETVAGYDPPFKVNNRHNEIWIDVWNVSKS